MKNNLIKSFLAIVGLCSFVSANAYDFEYDGMYFNVISTVDMTCAITYVPRGAEPYKGDFVIPESVTYNGRTLSVTRIDYSAFMGCSLLTSVTIPNSVTRIYYSAFKRCTALTSVTIPNSVTEIERSAFEGCTSLASVSIPNSVTEIESNAFQGCSSLTSVSIPNSVTEIGDNAFYRCSSLEQIKFEDGTTKLSLGSNYYKEILDVEYAYIGRDICNRYNPNYSPDEYKISDTLEIGPLVTSVSSWYEDVNTYYFPFSYRDITLLISHNTTPPKINSFSNLQYMNLEVRVPAEAIDAYRQDEEWKKFWNIQAIETSGLENIDAPAEFTVSVNGNTIQVTGAADNQPMEVFGIDGKNVYRGNGRSVDGLMSGIYIVRIGGKSRKVAVK